MFFRLFAPPELPEYRVQYLCSFRPIWYDAAPVADPIHSLMEARDEADIVCYMRRGRPVQVIDQTGRVVYSRSYVLMQ